MNTIKTNENKQRISKFVVENIVTLLFFVICIIEIGFAKQPMAFVLGEITTRLFRNLVLILALLVPVWAGMGLNFSIVLGAMAAQIGLIIVKNFFLTGAMSLVFAFAISIPFSIIFGYLTGKLFNRAKGQEMITGMILGFFAKGVYDLVFLFLCGPVIPIKNEALLLTNKIGLITPITLEGTAKNGLNNIWSITLDKFFIICFIALIVFTIINIIVKAKRNLEKPVWSKQYGLFGIVFALFVYLLAISLSKKFLFALQFTEAPMLTVCIIILVFLYVTYLSHSKLGSDINAVGQNRQIAAAMGINVNNIRIKAVIISTVLASLGQIIFIQEIGNFATYNAHENVGTFAIAALLVGGASIDKANIKHVFLGALLFHTMFIISPLAGKNIFGNAQMGEYFRVFACYAVIAISLALHAWKTLKAKQAELKI